jgi:hypothetical protein
MLAKAFSVKMEGANISNGQIILIPQTSEDVVTP